MVFKYTKQEIRNLLISIITLAIVFGFDDGRSTFEIGYWLTNFIKVLISVAVIVLVHDLGHDLIAKKHGFMSEYRLWRIKRYGFKPASRLPKEIKIFGQKKLIKSIPIGVIIAITVTLLTNGKFWWAAVSSYGLIIERLSRFGKKYINVTDYEDAKIALAGPFAVLTFILLLKLIDHSGVFSKVIFIASVMAVYDMLPIPGLDGWKVALGSKQLYIFSFLLTISIITLIQVTSTFLTIIVSAVLATALLILYYYFSVYK